jgi:hypothetical protein
MDMILIIIKFINNNGIAIGIFLVITGIKVAIFGNRKRIGLGLIAFGLGILYASIF